MTVPSGFQSRLQKIRDDPRKALFSHFHGTSSDGSVTVSVDMMGRLKKVRIRPGSTYEGAEQTLILAITQAYQEAAKAADLLDFDVAELAHQIIATTPPPTPDRTRSHDEDDDFDQPVMRRY